MTSQRETALSLVYDIICEYFQITERHSMITNDNVKGGDSPLLFQQQLEWDGWLATYHTISPGVWLRLSKKGAEERSISYAEALDVALCYGWIDGQKKSESEHYWLQKFTPRSPRSNWSKNNREKALRLIQEGRMRPAGLAEVERAKCDGRWEAAYDSSRSATVPSDLEAAFNGNKQAKEFFETLSAQNRYAILFRVQTAKKAETRARRIQKFVEMLARHEKLYP